MSAITASTKTHSGGILEVLAPSANGKLTLDVSDLWQILLHKMRFVLLCAVAGLLLGAAYLALSTRRYEATAQLQVMKEESGLSAARLGGGPDESSSDALDFNMTLQTSVNVLTSDTLALRVIQELKLPSKKEYHFEPSSLFGKKKSPNNASGTPEDSPAQRVWTLKRFHKNLNVAVLPGTRIIRLQFTSTDPTLAVQVLNQLLQDYVAYNFQVHYDTTLGPSEALTTELNKLKQQVAEADNHAVALQKAAGGFGVTDNYNVVLSRLEILNKAALDAESNRVLRQSVYQVTQSGDPELISTLVGVAGPVQGGGLTLIQQLRAQQAQVKAQYADDSVRYGENYPKLAQLNQQLESLRDSIALEVKKLGDRAKNDYVIAANQEASINAELTAQRALANRANSGTAAYLMAKSEADSDRQLYLTLAEKLRQVQLVAGLHSSSINVIDPARVPDLPSSPSPLLALSAGLFGGIFFGVVGAFRSYAKDPRVRNVEEAEALSGFPLLGIIPRIPLRSFENTEQSAMPAGPFALAVSNPARSSSDISSAIEAYRAVRTSILLQGSSKEHARAYMITSAMRSEGKSTTTINIASVFARMGAKTLLIDADLRDGSLAAKLGLADKEGLSEILTMERLAPNAVQQVAQVNHLYALTAGGRTPNPSELITSDAFSNLLAELRQQYEYIFVDTPPCIAVTDAVALASRVDGYVFVVRADSTTRQALTQSARRLEQTGTPCVGVIMNAVDTHSADYLTFGGYGTPEVTTSL